MPVDLFKVARRSAEVEYQLDDISIIAGGWSAKNVDLHSLPGVIVTVNDATMHVPRRDIIVSMDRVWLEKRWAEIQHFNVPVYARLSAIRNMYDEIRKPWVFPFDCQITDKFGSHGCMLNGPNSGYCALNLAFIIKPRRVHLVGMDMGRGPNGENHWYPPSPWWTNGDKNTSNGRYREWQVALKSGIEQCRDAGIEVIRLGA